MSQNPRVVLKAGRARALERRHPWVFSGAVARVEGEPGPGETVELRADDGRLLGRGAFSPRSQIAVRVWSFNPDEPVDRSLLRGRLERALELRESLGLETDAMRLVNAESDGLPGLVIDRYGDHLVCQLLSTGPERWRDTLVEVLGELVPGATGIYERSDAAVRAKEGLEPRVGLLTGAEPPELIQIHEGDCRFLVDVRGGHKTGFYLDQRDARRRLQSLADTADDVLDAFAYTGGFAVAALRAGAGRVTSVDSSRPALSLCAANIAQNGIDPDRGEQLEGDVFSVLRRFRDARRSFDLAVLDPPKFVESRAQLERGSRGYKDINLLALKLLRPGGTLLTFSCSGLMDPALHQKIVADAAVDAGREARIVGRLGQPADHPVALSFPEGRYLKGLVCRV
jgi:23S rRNA (cytosine1962-C5)-methyltransferase